MAKLGMVDRILSIVTLEELAERFIMFILDSFPSVADLSEQVAQPRYHHDSIHGTFVGFVIESPCLPIPKPLGNSLATY